MGLIIINRYIAFCCNARNKNILCEVGGVKTILLKNVKSLDELLKVVQKSEVNNFDLRTVDDHNVIENEDQFHNLSDCRWK